MRRWLFGIALLITSLSLNLFSQTKPGLDTTTFVVMGEGLAAGMANYGLSSESQRYSFPSLAAAQMQTAFPQPLIQPPGVGDVIGYPGQEVRLQTYPQGSVRQYYQEGAAEAPPLFVLNLSVPGLTLADSLSMRPVMPIAQKNMKQTVFNLLLGFPQLFIDNVPQWTQFEYAKAMFPTMSMIELGYYEVLDAAVTGDLSRLPDPTSFGNMYATIVTGLRGLQSQVIVTTIPNPLDTGYFSTPAYAGTVTFSIPGVIPIAYHLTSQDYVTRNGLLAISNQFANQTIGPLPAGSIMTAATAANLTAAVNTLNNQIVKTAQNNGAVVYDLNGYLHSVRVAGATAGSTRVTANYLGGFYSLDGIYPSPTGHALIANDVLRFLNATYQKSFSMVDVSSIDGSTPSTQVRVPIVEPHTFRSLRLPEPGGTQQ